MREWIDFEEEVLYKNRFFCNHNIMEHIKKLSETHFKTLAVNTLLYRSRVIERDQICKDARKILGKEINNSDVRIRCKLYKDLETYGFNEQNSGMPPVEKTVDGRANPKLIPYLYLAIHPYTSVVECKPYQFDRVSVAKFLLTKPAKIMDLNKFVNKSLSELEYDEKLINHLNYEFSRPVKGNCNEYIVTQFIAEFIKHLGFDGISYMSSLHIQGENIVLFDNKKTEFNGSFVYCINDIRFDIGSDIVNRHAPDIMPEEYKI